MTTNEMMTAGVLRGPGYLVVDKKYPKPSSIRKDEVLVKILASGLCRTDLTYKQGKVQGLPYSIVLGHEGGGEVVEVGSNVYNIKVGDKVITTPIWGCGKCDPCKEGWDNRCKPGPRIEQTMLGHSVDGLFAEYRNIPEKYAFKLPDTLDLFENCIIADAGATPYNALKNKAKVKKGDNVVIFGVGGLGGFAIYEAVEIFKANVIAVDIDEEKLKLAKRLGAKETLNSKGRDDVPRALKKMAGYKVDSVLDCVGLGSTFTQAVDTVSADGIVVLVGYTNQKADNFYMGQVMAKEKTVTGVWGAPSKLYPELIGHVVSGGINPRKLISNKYYLDQLPKAMDDFEKGKFLSRAVIII